MSDGPLSLVLDAFGRGSRSLDEVARSSGLTRDVVAASVEHLIRLGRLEARELAIGCPSGGCGSCASGAVNGGAGCGSVRASPGRTGPVLVTIGLRRSGA